MISWLYNRTGSSMDTSHILYEKSKEEVTLERGIFPSELAHGKETKELEKSL
jgi:hypothetical protein